MLFGFCLVSAAVLQLLAFCDVLQYSRRHGQIYLIKPFVINSIIQSPGSVASHLCDMIWIKPLMI